MKLNPQYRSRYTVRVVAHGLKLDIPCQDIHEADKVAEAQYYRAGDGDTVQIIPKSLMDHDLEPPEGYVERPKVGVWWFWAVAVVGSIAFLVVLGAVLGAVFSSAIK